VTSKPLFITPTRLEYNSVRAGLMLWLREERLELAQCGMGLGGVQAFLHRLQAQDRPQALILLGWAGGIAAELQPGDWVCADQARLEGKPPLPQRALAITGAVRGPLLTVPSVLTTPEEKAAVGSQGILAVEMEAYPLAEWAQEHEIPFYHARIILDARHEPLPVVAGGADETRFAWLRVLMQLLRRPATLSAYWSLLRRVRQISPGLENLARSAYQSLPQEIEIKSEN
jgi:hypothetical protein